MAIDTLKFKTKVLPVDVEALMKGSADGANVHGLFMQGAAWDRQLGHIVESEPRTLFIEMPVIVFECVNKD